MATTNYLISPLKPWEECTLLEDGLSYLLIPHADSEEHATCEVEHCTGVHPLLRWLDNEQMFGPVGVGTIKQGVANLITWNASQGAYILAAAADNIHGWEWQNAAGSLVLGGGSNRILATQPGAAVQQFTLGVPRVLSSIIVHNARLETEGPVEILTGGAIILESGVVNPGPIQVGSGEQVELACLIAGTYSRIVPAPPTIPDHTHDGSPGSGGQIDHNDLLNIGINTHVNIDQHITNPNIHFGDAPFDGTPYARQDLSWVPVAGGGDQFWGGDLGGEINNLNAGNVKISDGSELIGEFNLLTLRASAGYGTFMSLVGPEIRFDSAAHGRVLDYDSAGGGSGFGVWNFGDATIKPQVTIPNLGDATTLPVKATTSGLLISQAIDYSEIANPPAITTTFTGLTDTPNDYTGQAGKIPSVNQAEDALEFLVSITDVLGETWPSGLIDGGELNIVGGTDIQVIAGEGAIIDNYTNPGEFPVITGVTWANLQQPIGAPATAGSLAFYMINSAGALVELVNVLPTPAQLRGNIFLGYALHNGTAWNEVSSPYVVNTVAYTLGEFIGLAGRSFIESGGSMSEQAGFTLNQEAGVIWEQNRNWHVSKVDPNRESFAAQAPVQWRYVNQDFTSVGALTSVVDPGSWDNGGTVTPGLGGNNCTIQRLYLDQADNYWMLWGQEVFDNFTEGAASIGAADAADTIPFLLQNAILLGYAVVEASETDWTPDEARFFAASSGGSGGGSAPAPTTFLELTDTPLDYTGQALQMLAVNAGETALEFVPPPAGGGIPEAPIDGQPYSRQDAGWVISPGAGGGVPEAPNDGNDYVRNSLAWVIADYFSGDYNDLINTPTIPAGPPYDHTTDLTNVGTNTHAQIDTHIANTGVHFADAPADANDYVRNNNSWVIANYFSGAWGDLTGVPATFPPSAHAHVLADVTDSGSMAAVNDAPADGQGYVRQDNGWVLQSGGGGGQTITESSSEPVGPAVGDIWIQVLT